MITEKDKRFLRLNEAFLKNMTEVYLFFFQAILLTFTNFNKLLQTEEPMIQCLHGEIQVFMNKLASKFQPEMVRELKNDNLSFAKLDISLEKKRMIRI